MKRNRYFQWIAGENEGTISILDNITEYDGEYFYNYHVKLRLNFFHT